MSQNNPFRKHASPLFTPVRLSVAAVAACFMPSPVLAIPMNPVVVNGAASFDQVGKVLTVTNSNGTIINWDKFSIKAGETTRFNQPSASSAVMNRVLNDPSAIYGTLSSNGRVWLINPAGIMVGPSGRIDTAGFVASTLNVRNEDFLAGRKLFVNDGMAKDIINQGEIRTPAGGSVYLIGSNVSNQGIITTPKGETILAAGATVSLIDSATPGVKVEITGAEGNATNLGTITAEAGRIGIAGVIVRNSGMLNASSVVSEGGRIFLRASKKLELSETSRIAADGTAGGSITAVVSDGGQISGELVGRGVVSAQGDGSANSGGFVETSAAKVALMDIHVTTGNGEWLIDPVDFTISSGTAAQTISGIGASTLVNALGNNAVTITTDHSTAGNGDILVNAPVAWNSGNGLSLMADGAITVSYPVQNSGSGAIDFHAGSNITIGANLSTVGSINLTAGGNLVQSANTLISNGTSAGPNDITLTGVDITLRNVLAQRNVILNASGAVHLLGAGSGGFIDDTYFIYNLPFTFNFFGTNYTQAYITTNGLITFGNSTAAYSDSLAGLGSYRAIAPAWNDWTLEASTGRDIRIGFGGGNMTVLWDVGRFSSTAPAAKFEAVLSPTGSIRFNYGTAVTLGNDVTIGLSNGTYQPIQSQLMLLPNFSSTSINNLRSTTFDPNGSGGYIETLSATNTPLAPPGPRSGSDILGQGTGVVVTALGTLQINAGGIIDAPSRLYAQNLQFVSHGGASFTGDNQFHAISASRNFGSGDIEFSNTASPLTINGLINDGRDLLLDNFGGIVVAGAMSTARNLNMAAHSPITINNGASVTAGGDLTLVAFSSSVGSTTDLLTIAGVVSSSGGNVALTGGSGVGFASTASVSAPAGRVAAASPNGPVTVAPGAQLSAAQGVSLTSFGGIPVAPPPPVSTDLTAGVEATIGQLIQQQVTNDLDAIDPFAATDPFSSTGIALLETVEEKKEKDKDLRERVGAEEASEREKSGLKKLPQCS